jgi:homoserine O-acetyltransferase
MWAEKWPQMMDGVMALACLPVQIAGRNRQWRKMLTDAIIRDSQWHGGEYTEQPQSSLTTAYALTAIAGSSPIADQKRLPTRKAADDDVEDTASTFLATRDANDTFYQFDASRDYDPSADLEKITAQVVFVNSADDFINPPELGIAEREIKRVKHGKFVLIPASESTHGHGTHTWAVFWQKELKALLDSTAKI